MDDRERRVVSDVNSSYLDPQALGDIERLGIELREGRPLTVCDYDGDEDYGDDDAEDLVRPSGSSAIA